MLKLIHNIKVFHWDNLIIHWKILSSYLFSCWLTRSFSLIHSGKRLKDTCSYSKEAVQISLVHSPCICHLYFACSKLHASLQLTSSYKRIKILICVFKINLVGGLGWSLVTQNFKFPEWCCCLCSKDPTLRRTEPFEEWEGLILSFPQTQANYYQLHVSTRYL